jgi:hypothetical protein
VLLKHVIHFRRYGTCRVGAYLVYQVRGLRNVTECNTEVTPFDTRMWRIWHKRGQYTIQHECPNPMTLIGFGTRMIHVGPLVRRFQHDTTPEFSTVVSQSRPMKESPAGHLNASRTPIRQIPILSPSRTRQSTAFASKTKIATCYMFTISLDPYLMVKILQYHSN